MKATQHDSAISCYAAQVGRAEPQVGEVLVGRDLLGGRGRATEEAARGASGLAAALTHLVAEGVGRWDKNKLNTP